MSIASQHPDPETLAAFAEGRLGEGRQALVEHLDGCEECLTEVALVMSAASEARTETSADEATSNVSDIATATKRRFRPAWLMPLAAAVIIAVALPLFWERLHRSPLDELVALAPRSARLVEPRLTGGFAWAAYRGPDRASATVTSSERLKLGGAAGELIERAEDDATPDAQHAAGVAMVLVDQPSEAIARLEAAARASNSARAWSDLAAARYITAVELRRASLYPEALAAADAALRTDPVLPEALFNRALVLEKMGLTQEARRAWQRYLEVDAASQWAAEARSHLAELPAATGASRFKHDQPLLERAAAAGAGPEVRALVDAYRERARAFAEAEYLGRWGEAVQRNDAAEAARWLAVARNIGDALAQLSGEALLRDAVRIIDKADAQTRTTLAAAHVVYRRGRIAYSRGQIAPGERDLRDAAALFASAGDPMALMARHYAASARLARNDLAAARAELEEIVRDADAHPAYFALGAHARRELARASMPDDDWAGQIPTLTASAALFRRGGEHASEAFTQSTLAAALTFLGRADDAWSARISAFRALSAEAQSDLLPTIINAAVTAELRAGRAETALALSAVSRATQAPETEPILAIDTLLQRAMLETSSGSVAAAQEATRQAGQLAAALPDADLRAWQLADVDVVRGAQFLTSDPGNAAAPLTRAIDYYRSRSRTANLPEPLLLRARLFLRTGQPEQAVHDLEEGVQAVEQHPLHYEGVALGTGVLDAGNALFTEAIRLRLERGDTAGAFAYAERARGSPITLPELQRRLAGSGTLVLAIVALPAEVVTIAITHDDVAVARRPRTDRELAALAARAGAGDEQASALLYDDLVRPVDNLVARAAALIVVPDPSLTAVPFAALLDTVSRRRLVERLPVAMASSADSLQRASQSAVRSTAALGLPGADGSAPLPAAEQELADVTAFYRRATVVPPDRATWAALLKAAADFDIVHIAGHTERQPGEGEQALLFTMSEGGGVERVSWKRIVAAPAARARIVVLAACETLRPPSPHSRALSLGGAFAAGGADVIGTLVPIPDRDAHALFRVVHQHLAAGAGAAEALREAQLEAIRDEAAGRGARAWRAAAVLTRSIR